MTTEQKPPITFIEGQYTISFVGTSCGVVKCQSVQHMRNVLQDIYPNPGDPTRAFLLNPRNWQTCPEDWPYFVEAALFTAEEDYRVFVVRDRELTS